MFTKKITGVIQGIYQSVICEAKTMYNQNIKKQIISQTHCCRSHNEILHNYDKLCVWTFKGK